GRLATLVEAVGGRLLARRPDPHSMTRSARASIDREMTRPSAFAAALLIVSSNCVGCSIGRSPGLVPFRILSTYHAARRKLSRRLPPYVIRPPASANSFA